MTIDAEARVPRLPLFQLFLIFLRFGCLAFGGPVAQIAMIRQALVDDERWISPARFNRLLAILQVLPGPEAHELCVHLGMMSRGRIGGLLAGLGFMLPGLLLMLAAGWLYTDQIVGRAGVAGVLLGVQLAILAIIVRAVDRIGRHVIDDALLLGIAVGGCIATLIGTPFWIALLAGGAAYALSERRWAVVAVAAAAVVLALLVRSGAPGIATMLPTSAAVPGPATLAALFVAGLKGGLLTFGGAYTAIPYVRADTVGRGWISDASFLDGVAVAGVLPAPLVIFATFAGYVAGGLGGALAVTAGMFLPAFAFSMIFYERLETVVESAALQRLLAGVAAAVVGVIAATCAQLGIATAARLPDPWLGAAVFAVALAIAWRWKSRLAVPTLVAAGAAAGCLAFG